MNKWTVQHVVFGVFRVAALFVLLLVVGLLYYIFKNGFQVVNWSFLTEVSRNEGLEGGVLLSIIGTFLLVGLTSLIAFPVGILSGIYMHEYAKENQWKRFVNMMTNNLAGVPSVVFGLFGLAVFVKLFGFGASILAGALTLATLVLPIVIRTTEEALKQVDDRYRQASYALGATKWYTIKHVVLPAAFANIVSGLILSVGRIAGETAPIIFTVAASYLSTFPNDVFDQVMALPFTIYYMATGHPDLEAARPIAYGATVVLLLIVMSINLLARFMVQRDKLGSAIFFVSIFFPIGFVIYGLGNKANRHLAKQALNGAILGLIFLGVILLVLFING